MFIVNNESVKKAEQSLTALLKRNEQREKDLRTLEELIIMAAITKDGNKYGLS